MKLSFLKKEDGQTLLEALVALGTSVTIISAIVIAIIIALSNAQYGKNKNLATQYAQEGMEIVRQKRSNDWKNFKDLSGSYCLDKNSTILREKNPASINGCYSVIGDPVNNVDNFARQIDIGDSNSCNPPGGLPAINARKITVIVSWNDSKCTDRTTDLFCRKVELVSCLSDFQVVPSP